MWYRFEGKLPFGEPRYYTLEEALEIIDDALTHGFEFKVEQHFLYYREVH